MAVSVPHFKVLIKASHCLFVFVFFDHVVKMPVISLTQIDHVRLMSLNMHRLHSY